MGRFTWIKLYTEILGDPKMGRLPDYLWRRAVELFLLAGQTGTTGQLPPVEEMAWVLRLEPSKLGQNLQSLAEIGVVHEAEPGKWVVTHFAKRQAAMSDTERKQKQRAGENSSRQRHEPSTPLSRNGHEIVTEGEDEGEEEKEGEAEQKSPAAVAENPFVIYEKNIGSLTEVISEKIKLAETDYPPGWLPEAIRIAALRNKRRWDYIEGILRRWKTEGKDSGEKSSSDAEYLHSLQLAGYNTENAARVA
jgi:DnaD/phage-associated family protein